MGKGDFMGIDIYATIARQLRFKRLQAGLTLEALADAAGISTSFLAYLETNKKRKLLINGWGFVARGNKN